MPNTINIPEEVYRAMKVPDKRKQETLLTELAVALYKEEVLSFGKARELANMSKWDFHELGKRNINRHYNMENLKEDINYGNIN